MKKVKLISMLSIGFVGGGLLTLVPFVITSCKETKTPKLIIEGSQNNQISIHTTLNHSDSHTFHCHDYLGGLPSDVSWSIHTSNDSISIDSSTGVLTWGNNLDPDDKSSNEFTLSCSNGELTSEVYSVSIIVDQTPGNDICPNSWLQVSDSGALTLKAGVDKSQIHKLVIPSQLNGVDVVSIDVYAFDYCTSLTSVILPNSLTTIDGFAFRGCTSLTSINLPDTLLESIGLYAFYNCTSLTSVILPNSLTSIGNYAFYGCSSLTSIDLSNCASLTSTEDYAFYGCSSLTSVYLPDTLKIIGSNAFYGCSSLTSLTLPNSLTTIRSGAFCESSLTSLTLPNTLTSIAMHAFAYCTSLTSLSLLGSSTSIGNEAFRYCSSLTSITAVYTSDPSVGTGAFLDGSATGTIKNTGQGYTSQNLKSYLLAKGIPNTWGVI